METWIFSGFYVKSWQASDVYWFNYLLRTKWLINRLRFWDNSCGQYCQLIKNFVLIIITSVLKYKFQVLLQQHIWYISYIYKLPTIKVYQSILWYYKYIVNTCVRVYVHLSFIRVQHLTGNMTPNEFRLRVSRFIYNFYLTPWTPRESY